ncbi:hypothetical protein, partial [Klebsiella variicola]|uniref:hypothetical protein n=1 Tax=Klebsiella variicola TaxID=244366 RepID=UPI001C651AE8
KPPAQRAGILLPEGIPATAGIVNLRYKSCPEMAGQDQLIVTVFDPFHPAEHKVGIKGLFCRQGFSK